MTDLPRLTVTREQAHYLLDWRPEGRHVIRLKVPIPRGTRVEVGWWEPVDLADPHTRIDALGIEILRRIRSSHDF